MPSMTLDGTPIAKRSAKKGKSTKAKRRREMTEEERDRMHMAVSRRDRKPKMGTVIHTGELY